jgi:hypothetical protein
MLIILTWDKAWFTLFMEHDAEGGWNTVLMFGGVLGAVEEGAAPQH